MYAYAKTEDMGALEEFMAGQHQANLQSVGDRVFDECLYESARAIFAHIPNWGRLASTLVRLHQFQQAVDAARKANSPRTWKEVRVPARLPFNFYKMPSPCLPALDQSIPPVITTDMPNLGSPALSACHYYHMPNPGPHARCAHIPPCPVLRSLGMSVL